MNSGSNWWWVLQLCAMRREYGRFTGCKLMGYFSERVETLITLLSKFLVCWGCRNTCFKFSEWCPCSLPPNATHLESWCCLVFWRYFSSFLDLGAILLQLLKTRTTTSMRCTWKGTRCCCYGLQLFSGGGGVVVGSSFLFPMFLFISTWKTRNLMRAGCWLLHRSE